MRKVITLLFVIILFNAKAQTNFMATGATWHYLQPSGGFGPPYSENNEVIKYISDTIYQGKAVKVLSIAPYFISCANSGKTFFYSSNDSVFFHNASTLHTWELLYSFNTPVGQSWQVYLTDYNSLTDTVNIKVDSLKYISINSVLLKTLFVTYNNGYHSVICDRIGDINYLFDFHSRAETTADPCYSPYLLCYSDSLIGTYQPDTAKACTYSNPAGIKQLSVNNEQVTVYPNPSSGQVTISLYDKADYIQLIDMQGRLIYETKGIAAGEFMLDISKYNKGIYFIRTKIGDNIEKQKLVVE